MRYVLSGLVGFLLTLALSLPLQQLIRLKEAQAIALRAKPQASGTGIHNEQVLEEITVEVPPLGEVSRDLKEPRIKFMPVYPPEAAAKRVEGYVTLSFTIAKDGSVQNLKVVESSPSRVFDRAARRAVAKWNFGPTPTKEESGSHAEQRLRLVFNLKKALAADQTGVPGF